jgi:hypothetical protein
MENTFPIRRGPVHFACLPPFGRLPANQFVAPSSGHLSRTGAEAHTTFQGEFAMKKIGLFLLSAVAAIVLSGCGATTIAPNYQSTNPDLMRIGGDAPGSKDPETINMGSYCLQVVDKWKADGKTPDGQMIYTKDSFRKTVPCR